MTTNRIEIASGVVAGFELRRIRVAAGLSQAAIARECGTSQARWCKAEAGLQSPEFTASLANKARLVALSVLGNHADSLRANLALVLAEMKELER